MFLLYVTSCYSFVVGTVQLTLLLLLIVSNVNGGIVACCMKCCCVFLLCCLQRKPRALTQPANPEMSLPARAKPRSPTGANPSGSLPAKLESPLYPRDSIPEMNLNEEPSVLSRRTDPESSFPPTTIKRKTSQTVMIPKSSVPSHLEPRSSPQFSFRSSFNRRKVHQFRVEGDDQVDGGHFRRASVSTTLQRLMAGHVVNHKV